MSKILCLWPPASAEESNDEDKEQTMGNLEHNQQRYLFHSSQLLKRSSEMSPRLNLLNPPLASDLTEDFAEKNVPFELFNFLAWVTGACCEPVTAFEKKLLS